MRRLYVFLVCVCLGLLAQTAYAQPSVTHTHKFPPYAASDTTNLFRAAVPIDTTDAVVYNTLTSPAKRLSLEVWPRFAGTTGAGGAELVDTLIVSVRFKSTGGIWTPFLAVDSLLMTDSTSVHSDANKPVKVVKVWSRDDASPGPIARILRDADLDPGLFTTLQWQFRQLDTGANGDSLNVTAKTVIGR